ncbi:hypothetical protein PoB_001763700 [Plakobranchus ocellatus]|uniref:Uncharacterized protein n=1 Tax=Plakobranchus ocellatus TaxID=259542 RepID=A0AAV3Z9D5_9GAST|nr:hypothetical protein PoB_001763700 [Plakobranchus ocellatus]
MFRKSAISHKLFRLTVSKQLVNRYSMHFHITREKKITDLEWTLAQHHTRTVFPVEQRPAGSPLKSKVKTSANEAKETRDSCAECQIYLYKDYILAVALGCVPLYHKQ